MATKWEDCSSCKGTGTRPFLLFWNRPCPACGGEGKRTIPVPATPSPFQKKKHQNGGGNDLDFTKKSVAADPHPRSGIGSPPGIRWR